MRMNEIKSLPTRKCPGTAMVQRHQSPINSNPQPSPDLWGMGAEATSFPMTLGA